MCHRRTLQHPHRTEGERRARRRFVEPLEPRQLFATAWYVDASSPGPVHDGSAWSAAFTDLQQALAAAGSGDQIRVAQGVYTPTTTADRTATFQLKSGVSIDGGYAGNGAADPDARDVAANPTVLSGDIGVTGDTSDNSFAVVTGSGADATAVLDGVTITAGSAGTGNGGGMFNLSGSPTIHACTFAQNYGQLGAAMFNNSASPTLTDCTFVENHSTGTGGAIEDVGSSAPIFTGCTFTGNTSMSGGGAIAHVSSLLLTLTDCQFASNTSGNNGGAISFGLMAVTNCTFAGNTATNDGGGVYQAKTNSTFTNCAFTSNTASRGGALYNNATSPSLRDCTFTGNSAVGSASTGGVGGAIYNSSSNESVTNCRFDGNRAFGNGVGPGGGGAVYNFNGSPTVSNCVFLGNASTEAGGAVLVTASASSSPELINCTFTQNIATAGGAIYVTNVSTPTVSNCVLWGDAAVDGEITLFFASATISYSDSQGGFDGTGNVDADPHFVRNPSPGADGVWGTADDDFGNLRLSDTSPCIDAGSNDAVAPGVTTDLGGNERIVYGTVDIGAYEWHFPGDANGDRTVDLTDFTILAANFNQSGRDYAHGNFDYDAAGNVDLTDFTILAANFNKSLPPPSIAATSLMPTATASTPASPLPPPGDDRLIDGVIT